MPKITILGINGHIGRYAAQAFAAAGWTVTGMGRSDKHAIPGVRFVRGDADAVPDMARAVADADVVLNALNLPYDKWDKGRAEAQLQRVLAAIGPASGKTLLFPGNIYNYAATDRLVTPDLPQRPQTPRGEIRKRMEEQLRAAAARGDVQVLILRAGDFYAPGNSGDWFDQAILREAGKGRLALPDAPETGHSWAYLPDLGRAFEKLAWHRGEFGAFDSFHFAGHYLTNAQLKAAILAAAPVPLTETRFPWTLFGLLGLAMPMLREVIKMRYLWQHGMELRDPRLDAILGPDFGTSCQDAIAATVAPFFPTIRAAAA